MQYDAIYNAINEDFECQTFDFKVNRKAFFDNLDRIFKRAEGFIGRSIFIVCFSETVKSITMWSQLVL